MNDNPYITAVDFDGTLVENEFPNIGPIKEEIAQLIRDKKENGEYIILWTCRAGEDLEAAVQFCEDNDIPIDSVNKDAPFIIEAFGKNPAEPYVKVFANEYIDDRAINVDSIVRV